MLMTALFIPLYAAAFMLECWVLYIAVMSFKAQKDTLHPVVKVLAYIILAFGLILDFFLTIIVGTVLFASWPKFSLGDRTVGTAWWKRFLIKGEWTFTARLKRHQTEGGRRGKMAAWICEELLNPFVVGGHC